MNLTVQYINPNHVAQSWELVAPFLDRALVFSQGDYNLDQLKSLIILGQQTLLVAVDEANEVRGAASIAFINTPNSRIAFITTIGGKLITNEDTFAQLRAFLISQGATKIQGYVRQSMAKFRKKYGFEEKAALVEATL